MMTILQLASEGVKAYAQSRISAKGWKVSGSLEWFGDNSDGMTLTVSAWEEQSAQDKSGGPVDLFADSFADHQTHIAQKQFPKGVTLDGDLEGYLEMLVAELRQKLGQVSQ
jgi:hypothetical protein